MHCCITLCFLVDCPFSIGELKLKFLQEWVGLAYRRNQKNNDQIFYYQLLLKWSGTTCSGRDYLFQTNFRMPTSTFYRKYTLFSKRCEKETELKLQQQSFIVWFDNFTKIFGRDYKFREDGKSYTMYDLTVVCAFVIPSPFPVNPTLLEVTESQSPVHKGPKNFEAKADLIFQFPSSQPKEMCYKRYEGFFPFFFKIIFQCV